MLKKLSEVVEERMGYVPEREYYRIDLIGYAKKEEKHSLHRSLQSYTWNLELAIEHENDYRLWADEVVKLAHIACPLRVVIGYLPQDENRYPREKVMKKLAKSLKDVKAWALTKSEPFLLIIGDCKLKSDEDRCRYRAYLYQSDADTFVQI